MAKKAKVKTTVPFDAEALAEKLGKKHLIDVLKRMLLIRNFETRAEAAYQHGKVGGFLHVYTGQEAICTSAIDAMGADNWWSSTYRCHAWALELGVTPNEAMAELYGRTTGNAQGRGGSMHFYTDRLLGGAGIVGGQIPIGVGAAFSSKYQKTGQIAVILIGDGAVPQGSFHESANLAALWDLPALFVIENNEWGMGTATSRAVSVDMIAEKKAPGYGMEGYTCDGQDYFACYQTFSEIHKKMKKTNRPVMLEMKTQRFRGHSVSDPGVYRSKEDVIALMEEGPINRLRKVLEKHGWLDEAGFKKLDKEQREVMVEAMKYADESPWPDPATLEEGVFA